MSGIFGAVNGLSVFWDKATSNEVALKQTKEFLRALMCEYPDFDKAIEELAASFPLPGNDEHYGWAIGRRTSSSLNGENIIHLPDILHRLYAFMASAEHVTEHSPLSAVLIFIKIVAEELCNSNNVDTIRTAINIVGEWYLFTPDVAAWTKSDMAAIIGLNGKSQFIHESSDGSLAASVVYAVRKFNSSPVMYVLTAVLPRKDAVRILFAVVEMMTSGKEDRYHVECMLVALMKYCPAAFATKRTPELVQLFAKEPLDSRDVFTQALEWHHYWCRLELVQLMRTLWLLFGGKRDGKAPLTHFEALLRTLVLRRFCRVRGPDELDMGTEVVEPFARDIAMFL